MKIKKGDTWKIIKSGKANEHEQDSVVTLLEKMISSSRTLGMDRLIYSFIALFQYYTAFAMFLFNSFFLCTIVQENALFSSSYAPYYVIYLFVSNCSKTIRLNAYHSIQVFKILHAETRFHFLYLLDASWKNVFFGYKLMIQ